MRHFEIYGFSPEISATHAQQLTGPSCQQKSKRDPPLKRSATGSSPSSPRPAAPARPPQSLIELSAAAPRPSPPKHACDAMATSIASRRLSRELAAISKEPIPHVVARPLEDNILEWHYVITATSGTPYAGGHYHGKLKFPADYPLRPPSVLMLTPSGRFKTNRRLCLSMSDFHPESWNPMWSVSTILTGLYSFMLEDAPTLGSVDATLTQRKELATRSLAFNAKDETFRTLFPELVDVHEARKKADLLAKPPPPEVTEPAAAPPLVPERRDDGGACSLVVAGGVACVAVVALLVLGV